MYKKKYEKFIVYREGRESFCVRYDLRSGVLRVGGRVLCTGALEAWLASNSIDIPLERVQGCIRGEMPVKYSTFRKVMQGTWGAEVVSSFRRMLG